MQWVLPQTVVDLLIMWWKGWCLKPKQRVIWDVIPLAVMWTIWNKKRNAYVFENSNPDRVEILGLIKIRVALCVKVINGDVYKTNSTQNTSNVYATNAGVKKLEIEYLLLEGRSPSGDGHLNQVPKGKNLRPKFLCIIF